jgi:predicted MPP superfamily phosphohydrolase
MALLRIAIASDLHFERGPRPLFFAEQVDVIVLAGDIAVGKQAADVAIEMAELYPETHVVWVAGNHESYDRDIDDLLELHQDICWEHPRVHFLENSAASIRGITFVGCTLWTDFSIYGDPERAMATADRLTDFSVIKRDFDRRFRPQDAAARFRTSYCYLEPACAVDLRPQSLQQRLDARAHTAGQQPVGVPHRAATAV